MWRSLALAFAGSAFGLTACGAEKNATAPAMALVDSSGVDFGDDASEWSNDDECDDPRFQGPGMTNTPLLDSDIRHDATDCREAYERGELTLRE